MLLQPTNLLCAFCLGLCLIGTANAQTTYQLLHKISLPGDGKWDYLKMDGERERLYVSHTDRVHVIDLTTDKPIAEITGPGRSAGAGVPLKGIHGIALAKAAHKGYISNAGDSTVTVFDDNTFKILSRIPVPGRKADAILYDKFSDRVFVFCNGSGNAVVIDAKTDKVVGNVMMGGAPEFAATDDKGLIYNNNEDTHEVVAFDAKTLAIKHRFSLAPNAVPTGLAIDVVNNRLFSTCRKTKTLVVLDATSGKIIQTVPIGAGVDGVVYEKGKHLIITSNGEGTATIIQQNGPDSYAVVQTLKTQPGQKTIVHRGTTHRIYLSGANYLEDGKTVAPGTFGVSVYGPEK